MISLCSLYPHAHPHQHTNYIVLAHNTHTHAQTYTQTHSQTSTLCCPREKKQSSHLVNITMSMNWVINMTQSLHWSPISSQHRDWNFSRLLYIITISLRQTPQQGKIKPYNHIQGISRTLLHIASCFKRKRL